MTIKKNGRTPYIELTLILIALATSPFTNCAPAKYTEKGGIDMASIADVNAQGGGDPTVTPGSVTPGPKIPEPATPVDNQDVASLWRHPKKRDRLFAAC